jgi:hypothetical protein
MFKLGSVVGVCARLGTRAVKSAYLGGQKIYPSPGIRAFDGSDVFYRYATIFDIDCCFINSYLAQINGWATDGQFTVRFDNRCSNVGVIVESTNWYGQSGEYSVGQEYTANFGYSPDPTYKSLAINPGCCNEDGSKTYVQLTEQIT